MGNENLTIEQIARGALIRAMRNPDSRGTDISLEEAASLQTCGGKIEKLDEPFMDNCFKHTISYLGYMFKVLTDVPSEYTIALGTFLTNLEEF